MPVENTFRAASTARSEAHSSGLQIYRFTIPVFFAMGLISQVGKRAEISSFDRPPAGREYSIQVIAVDNTLPSSSMVEGVPRNTAASDSALLLGDEVVAIRPPIL